MAEVNEEQNASMSMQDSVTKRQPWSPNLIAIITILFSMIPGGILHALNYSRLGYPQKKKSSLISNVTMAVFLIFVSLYTDLPYIFFLVINLAYAGYFFKSQDSIFQDYMNKGGKKGSMIGPVVFSVLITALFVGLSLGYDHLKTSEFEKALSLMKDANYPEAEQIFLSYKKYEPKEESTYYNLALIYQKTGRHDLAIVELKSLLRLNPKDVDAQSLLDELTGKVTTTTKVDNGEKDK